MTAPLDQLVGYGAPGVMLVIALLALRGLYLEHKAERAEILRELAEERDARIQDAKDNTALLLRIQQATTDAIGKLYDLAKARESDR